VNGTVQLCDWTSGAIVRNGPFAKSWDVGRAVPLPRDATKILFGKQHKFMAFHQPSKKTDLDFGSYFEKQLTKERNKALALFKQLCEDCKGEQWQHVFVFMTNWPLNVELDPKCLPDDTLVYCQKNFDKYYSRVVHARMAPWLENPGLSQLLSTLKV
jgi:hypothetical protein